MFQIPISVKAARRIQISAVAGRGLGGLNFLLDFSMSIDVAIRVYTFSKKEQSGLTDNAGIL